MAHKNVQGAAAIFHGTATSSDAASAPSNTTGGPSPSVLGQTFETERAAYIKTGLTTEAVVSVRDLLSNDAGALETEILSGLSAKSYCAPRVIRSAFARRRVAKPTKSATRLAESRPNIVDITANAITPPNIPARISIIFILSTHILFGCNRTRPFGATVFHASDEPR